MKYSGEIMKVNSCLILMIITILLILFTGCLNYIPNGFCLLNTGDIFHHYISGSIVCNNSATDGNTMDTNNKQYLKGDNTITATPVPVMHMLYVANSGDGPPDPNNIKLEWEKYDRCDMCENITPVEEMALVYGWDKLPEIYDANYLNQDVPTSIITYMQYGNCKKNNLLIINSITRGRAGLLEWPSSVSPMWLDMTDKGILCIADSSNNITLMDTNSANNTASTIPMGNNAVYDMAVGNSDRRLFCALMGGEPSVGVIDIISNSYIKTINLPKMEDDSIGTPRGIGAYRGGNMAYVALGNASAGELVFINTKTNTVEDAVTVGKKPFGVGVTPDGSKVFVANSNSNTVSVVDALMKKVTADITVGSSPLKVALSPDGLKAVVTNHMSNSVSVIDVKTNSVIATIPVGKAPMGVCISKDGKRAYTANHGSDDVSVIDLINNSFIGNTIPFPGGKPCDVVVK